MKNMKQGKPNRLLGEVHQIVSIPKQHLFKIFHYFKYHSKNAFDHFQFMFYLLKYLSLLEKDFSVYHSPFMHIKMKVMK